MKLNNKIQARFTILENEIKSFHS